jgi:hypothetical protein
MIGMVLRSVNYFNQIKMSLVEKKIFHGHLGIISIAIKNPLSIYNGLLIYPLISQIF